MSLHFVNLKVCPNCGDEIEEHPITHYLMQVLIPQESRTKQDKHRKKCPLEQDEARRSIAVTAAILFVRANQ